MVDPYKRVQPGERLAISAQAWNRLLDGISMPIQTGGELGSIEPAGNTILVKNVSGENVPRFGVLGVSGVLVNPATSEAHARDFARRPAISGVKPSSAAHNDAFVISLEPLRPNQIGPGICSGVFACKVDVDDPLHTRATPDVGTFKLVSSYCGLVQLLWKQPGTGVDRWAIGVM